MGMGNEGGFVPHTSLSQSSETPPHTTPAVNSSRELLAVTENTAPAGTSEIPSGFVKQEIAEELREYGTRGQQNKSLREDQKQDPCETVSSR
jgi:hypothetical protein